MRLRKIQLGSSWPLGELCEVLKCLLLRGLRPHCLCTMFLVSSSINVSIFHITWLDTLWTDLAVYHQRKTTKWKWANYWINIKSLDIWNYYNFDARVCTFVPWDVTKSLWKCNIQYLVLTTKHTGRYGYGYKNLYAIPLWEACFGRIFMEVRKKTQA